MSEVLLHRYVPATRVAIFRVVRITVLFHLQCAGIKPQSKLFVFNSDFTLTHYNCSCILVLATLKMAA